MKTQIQKPRAKRDPFVFEVHPNVLVLTAAGRQMKILAAHCENYASTVRETVRGWRQMARLSGRRVIVRRFDARGEAVK
jgi:hypothetical protein